MYLKVNNTLGSRVVPTIETGKNTLQTIFCQIIHVKYNKKYTNMKRPKSLLKKWINLFNHSDLVLKCN